MEDNKLIIYKNNEGNIIVDAIYKDETLWLSQKGMSKVFECSTDNISLHLKHIFEDNELDKKSVTEKCSLTADDGKNYNTTIFSLDAIIAVGYRINSKKATEFRIWATKILKEYMIKGVVMDDERLKQAKNSYFDELLERIRDIRSSEKLFWQKILDIYATSIDYDPSDEASQEFFKTIQNKMHFATHGHTAAEIIYQRVDSTKPFIGMTNFSGCKPTKKEASIAKNYLNNEELDTLNRIVTTYLEFAELQAKKRKTMKMRDWIKKLDDFLSLSDFDVLQTKGKISHTQALKKANEEYEKYKVQMINEKSKVQIDFEKVVASLGDKK